MIVLLLSLVNNEDLAEIKDFFEATYGIKADRTSLELTILKSYLSYRSTQEFLRSLVSFERFQCCNKFLTVSYPSDGRLAARSRE